MTALVRIEVERTFSDSSRYSAGLPGHKTLEAERQDRGNFRDPGVRWSGYVAPIHARNLTARTWKFRR